MTWLTSPGPSTSSPAITITPDSQQWNNFSGLCRAWYNPMTASRTPWKGYLRKHLEKGIQERHTQPCLAVVLGWPLGMQCRSHAFVCTNWMIFVVPKCMVCVCYLPLAGQGAPHNSKTCPDKGHFRVLFCQWTPPGVVNSKKGNETNCVNYKYYLLLVPAVSYSCIDWGSQLQTSCAGTLTFKGGPFDCSVEVMPWHTQTR